ncbi:MAG: hypothetical protein KatS3mg108_3129 [Isosphaeraceae bacterium]|jgi:hypothetical protein|nr:MAG: hypothetical protein KatS3mg108_3129 [Isosphaeraceae bacterium]
MDARVPGRYRPTVPVVSQREGGGSTGIRLTSEGPGRVDRGDGPLVRARATATPRFGFGAELSELERMAADYGTMRTAAPLAAVDPALTRTRASPFTGQIEPTAACPILTIVAQSLQVRSA